MSGVQMQRVGPLGSVPVLLAEFGVDPADAMSGLDLSPGILDNPDNVLPFAAAGALLANCARLTGCAHFGLLLGARHDHAVLGLIGRLIGSAATLGEALFAFVSHQHRNSRGAVVYLTRQGDNFLLGYAVYNRHAPGSDQIYDLATAVGVNMVRRLAGPKAGPREVLLCHRAPASRKPYDAVFGCPVHFNQGQAALVLSPEALQLPIAEANPEVHRQLSARVEEILAMGDLDLASHVRHILKPRLLVGEATSEAIARQAGIHVRTLNRRLREEKTSYRQLEQQVRFAIACELLEITDLQVSDISAVLGYGTPSAFVRAFQRWNAMPPSQWRQSRAEAAP